MVGLLKKLRDALDQGGDPSSARPSEEHPHLTGAFVSWHEHSSGSELGIVHLGCHLWQATAKGEKDQAP
jgi:hypothetical protein